MKKRWDEALRSLARRSQGPFRALAYGVTGSSDGEADLIADLGSLLSSQGIGGGEVVAEVADPFTGALQRALFKGRVLPWAKSPGRLTAAESIRSEGEAPVQARCRLEAIASDLAGFLETLEEGSAENRRGAVGLRLVPVPAPSQPKPSTRSRRDDAGRPLLLVRQFEDLGCDAEGIAGTVEAILIRGAHLLIVSEELDTRTREGRAMAALALRLGGIKADRARERSLKELARRRDEMQVYGPVPFGFARRDQELVPLPGEMEMVVRVRELARRGVSHVETAIVLNREDRTWKDGSPWTARRVRQILRNTLYDRALREDIA